MLGSSRREFTLARPQENPPSPRPFAGPLPPARVSLLAVFLLGPLFVIPQDWMGKTCKDASSNG